MKAVLFVVSVMAITIVFLLHKVQALQSDLNAANKQFALLQSRQPRITSQDWFNQHLRERPDVLGSKQHDLHKAPTY